MAPFYFIILVTTASIWLLGTYQLWKNQNKSETSISVNLSDRLIAIFWPPCYAAMAISLLFSSQKKRVRNNSTEFSTQDTVASEAVKTPVGL